MIQLRDATLVAVVRGGAAHLGLGGRLDIIRSEDGGRTWSNPMTAIDTPWDDRNPAFGQMPDGTLVLAYAEAQSYKPDGSFDWDAGPFLPFFITSNDGGRTWSDKKPFSSPWPEKTSPYGKIIVCNDGTALMSIYKVPSHGTGLLRSEDNGRTWGDFSVMPGHDETQVIELPDGRLMAFSRMEGDQNGGLLLSESDDKGYTWVRTRKMNKPNEWPFDATILQSGRLLLLYGLRTDPFGIGLAISDDLGKTWPEEKKAILAWDSLDSDTGYPSAVQLCDGTIVVMHYAVGTTTLPGPQAIVTRFSEQQLIETFAQR